MEFLKFFHWVPSFFKDNPLVAALAALVLIFLIFRRPRLVMTVILMGLLVSGVLYLVLSMSSAGVEQKQKLIERSVVPGMETLVEPAR
jgi:hypothetical protein